MVRVDNGIVHISVSSVVQRQSDSAQVTPDPANADEAQGDERVTISDKAYAVLGSPKNATQSTTTAEQLEKMIKQLEEQIEKKQIELRQVMTNQALEDEERLQQAQAIQAELAMLQASLVYAYNSLAEAAG